MSVTADIRRDYARCEAITRAQAANFYYGIRLLPRERRQAMSAVYAFARRIDDIGDGTLAAAEKLRQLQLESCALEELEAGRAPGAAQRDAVMAALLDARERFSFPPGALGELITGVRMDVDGVRYESFDDLVVYCRCVAGAVGRVCLAIFGLRDGAGPRAGAETLADELGVALQITNVLRDVREDADNGRVYLPAEDLRRFGLLGDDAGEGVREDTARRLAVLAAAAANGDSGDGDGGPGGQHSVELGRMAALIRFEAARGREWFDRGMPLAERLDRRSAACLLAMAGIYRRLLERIERDPLQALGQRMSLPAHEKALVAARALQRAGT